MITKSQQQIIDSITSEFERINSIESKPISQLAQQIKSQITEHNSNQEEFKLQTESYEIANQNLFEDICKQIKDLCDELELELEIYVDEKRGKGYTDLRKIKIGFPHFVDTTNACGDVYFTIYAFPFSTTRYGIKGLEMVGLYFQEGIQEPKYYQNNILEFIAEKIVQTHKRYSK